MLVLAVGVAIELSDSWTDDTPITVGHTDRLNTNRDIEENPMNSFASVTDGQVAEALIGMYDINGFARIARANSDIDTLALIQSVCAAAHRRISDAGGLIVKYIGDAALFAFPDERADEATSRLFDLKEELEKLIQERGFSNGLTFSLHFGEVVFGKLPPFTTWDIIGEAVNTLWTLDRGVGRSQIVISPQAFRKLGSMNRKRFHKYTPPIVYLSEKLGQR